MNLILIACLILVMNYILTFIQVKNYRKEMDNLISKYKGNDDYYMFSGQARRKAKSGSIAMLIVDNNYKIMECQIMKGVSVLTHFKEIEKYKGQHVGTLLSNLHDSAETNRKKKKRSKVPAISSALMEASENALLSISKKKTF